MKILELQRGGSILSSSRFAAETPIENLLIESICKIILIHSLNFLTTSKNIGDQWRSFSNAIGACHFSKISAFG